MTALDARRTVGPERTDGDRMTTKGEPMTVTDRTDATAEEFAARIAPFEGASVLVESWEGSNALADHFESGIFDEERVVEEVARALAGELARRCLVCLRPTANERDWEVIPEGEGEHLCWEPDTCGLHIDGLTLEGITAAAAVAAYRATQDGGAQEAVRSCPTCVREGGPYRCCPHCADDPTFHEGGLRNHHDLPCSTCVAETYR